MPAVPHPKLTEFQHQQLVRFRAGRRGQILAAAVFDGRSLASLLPFRILEPAVCEDGQPGVRLTAKGRALVRAGPGAPFPRRPADGPAT